MGYYGCVFAPSWQLVSSSLSNFQPLCVECLREQPLEVQAVASACVSLQCNYAVSALLCILIFLAFKEDAYVSSENIGGLVLLLLLYG